MQKRKYRRLAGVLGVGLSVTFVFTGCGKKYDYSKIPYAKMLTRQEVIDDYAKSLSYKSIAEKGVSKTKIQWNEVPSSITEKLWTKTQQIIETNQLNAGYEDDMSVAVHDYVKLLLDDLVLTKPDGGNYTYTEAENNGYYFVTVNFGTKLNGQGTFKDAANYLGIDGFIISDANGNPVLNKEFVDGAYGMSKVNAARSAARLTPYTIFADANLTYAPQTQTVVAQDTPTTDAEGNAIVSTDIGGGSEATTGSAEGESAATDNSGNGVGLSDDSSDDNSGYSYSGGTETAGYNNLFANTIRQVEYDNKYINSAIGSSTTGIPVVPPVGMVYNPVETNGELSGYGIFNEGSYGLRDFGYAREAYGTGKISLTFVFKQNADDRDKFDYKYCYINNYETNIEMKDSGVTLSDDINTQLDQTIERIDRAFCNEDIAGLMNKSNIEPSDLGIRLAELRTSSNILTFSTHRVKTLARKGKQYLVELERTTEESAKGFGNTAKYKDKYYAVIRQNGTDFVLNDIVWVSRELLRIPEPEADDAITRRLTSLNLAGAVDESVKPAINQLLNRVYNATNNVGYYTQYDKSGNVVVDNGIPMYGLDDQFDSNKELLKSARKEYLESQIVNRAQSHMNSSECMLKGKVVSWIDGYSDQVELTTEEFYDFSKIKNGIYVKNYYLVSHYGNRWVIDDIVPIEEKEVEGNEYEEKVSLFSNVDNKVEVIATDKAVEEDTSKGESSAKKAEKSDKKSNRDATEAESKKASSEVKSKIETSVTGADSETSGGLKRDAREVTTGESSLSGSEAESETN